MKAMRRRVVRLPAGVERKPRANCRCPFRSPLSPRQMRAAARVFRMSRFMSGVYVHLSWSRRREIRIWRH